MGDVARFGKYGAAALRYWRMSATGVRGRRLVRALRHVQVCQRREWLKVLGYGPKGREVFGRGKGR